MASKIRDCAECADQHYVSDMYPTEIGNICEPCFHDTFEFTEEEIAEITK